MSMSFDTQRRRNRLYQAMRDFFTGRGYLEVETPALSPALIPESPIEAFETHYRAPRGGRPLYLIPSPEVHMKKLIAAGSGNIFQFSRCFRNGEQSGRQHNPEFTMLEWYTMGADYLDSIKTAEALLQAVLPADAPAAVRPPLRRMSMQEAFAEYAGFDLAANISAGALEEQIARLGLSPSGDAADWEERFNRLFLTFVEPALPADRPLILYDYPRNIPCLARGKPGTPWRERWELYLNGIEVANCFSEETDPQEVRRFFHREAAKQSMHSQVLPDTDEEFAALFDDGSFPPCSGGALGFDRLMMAAEGADSIEGVIFFPISATVEQTNSES
jgi:lysyl-tRNA synthetase class 2